MDTYSLKLFLSVADTLSFSVTAEKENISQSSLSKAIIKLEDELDVKLFDRTTHPITLTSPGRMFAKSLRDLEPAFNSAVEKAKRQGKSDRISLALIPSALSFDFKHILWSFSEIYPNITVQQSEYEELSEISEMLQNGLLDFIITRRPTKVYPRYRRTVLDYDDIVVIFPLEHKLAGKESVSLDDILLETFFISDYSTGIMEYLRIVSDFVPKESIYKPKEKVHVSIAGLGHRKGINLFYRSDIKLFSTENVSVARLTGIPLIPVVLLENEENDSKLSCNIFKEYLKNHM